MYCPSAIYGPYLSDVSEADIEWGSSDHRPYKHDALCLDPDPEQLFYCLRYSLSLFVALVNMYLHFEQFP